jgi:hypothetical protein
MAYWVRLPLLILTATSINIPLGYLRQGFARFAFGWIVCVHASIPFIIYLRIKSGFGMEMIPLTLAGAVAGQIVGGRVRQKIRPKA